jgi:hypothetical protein
VGRLPGQQQVSVLNTPSGGHERDVANGLFIYTTEASPGPAVSAVANGGAPMTVLDGTTTEQVSAYATDADGTRRPTRSRSRCSRRAWPRSAAPA